MELLTFPLLAALLSRAGFNRIHPRAGWALLLAALAPELDRASRLISPEAYLNYAYAALHSLLAAPALTLASALIIRRLCRNACAWRGALVLAATGLAANVLVAAFGFQGIRLLWPVSDRWFRAGFLPGWDLWMLALLALAWAGLWVLGLASAEMGAARPAGRAPARIALCLALGLGFGRFLLHERAVAVLDSRLYEGAQPLRVAAIPNPLNPLRYTGLVESYASIRVYRDFNPWRDFDPFRAEVLQKPETRPALEQAGLIPALRAFQQFYPWTHWTAAPVPEPEGAWQIEVVDLTRPAPRAPTARALFSPDGRLLRTELRLGSP